MIRENKVAEPVAEEVFLRAAARVLELMFFDSLCGRPAIQQPPEDAALARVVFRGSRLGWLEIAVDANAAVALAGNFLGLDEAPVWEEVESTLAELANMLCGAFLSLFDPHGSFEIGTPRISHARNRAAELDLDEHTCWQVLPIGAGGLYWRIFWEEIC